MPLTITEIVDFKVKKPDMDGVDGKNKEHNTIVQ